MSSNKDLYDPSKPNDLNEILENDLRNYRNKKFKKNKNKKVNEELSGEDKAYRILKRMGWKGKGLGKNEQGILYPIICIKENNKGIIINKNENTDY